MNLEQLEAKVNSLEKRLSMYEDIEAIQRLQRSYGYYLEHAMYNELAELWADDGELIWCGWGTFKGKERIRNVWRTLRKDNPKEFLHIAIQFSPIVTVAPDGKTAKGRWYCLGGGGSQTTDQKGQTSKGFFWVGLDENSYVKENGVWKIKIFEYSMVNFVFGADQFMTPEQVIEQGKWSEKHMTNYGFSSRTMGTEKDYAYSGYIRPFHFTHPVTGQKTTESEWNTSLKNK